VLQCVFVFINGSYLTVKILILIVRLLCANKSFLLTYLLTYSHLSVAQALLISCNLTTRCLAVISSGNVGEWQQYSIFKILLFLRALI